MGREGGMKGGREERGKESEVGKKVVWEVGKSGIKAGRE